MRTSLVCASMAIAIGQAGAQALVTTTGFSNGTPENMHGSTTSVIPGQGVQLGLPTNVASFRIYTQQGTNWSGYTHLQIRFKNASAFQPLFIGIDSGPGTGWYFVEFMLSPGPERTVIIPLDSALSGGLWGFPQPPTNSASQLISMGTIVKNDIRRIVFTSMNETAGFNLLLEDVRPVNSPIPTSNFIDKYGQQNVSFPGRVTTDQELITRDTGAGSLGTTYPYPADTWGGVRSLISSLGGTRKWSTKKQNGRWYLIDPDGNRFFSTGICNVGEGSGALVQGRENWFTPNALPPVEGEFSDHWRFNYNPTGQLEGTFGLYSANLQRKYGSDWRTEGFDVLKKRMKTWGFNTAGPTSDHQFWDPATKIPFTEEVPMSGNYARLSMDWIGNQVPDPFDPAWSQAVYTKLSAFVQQFNNNPYLVGVFVDNEQPWGKPWGETDKELNIGQAILRAPRTQPAKEFFRTWLEQRYGGNIALLNLAWGTGYINFWAVRDTTSFVPRVMLPGMEADMRAFTLLYARRYFSTIKSTLNTLGFKGLYLGCRFQYFTPEVLQAAKESCDVVSFTAYEMLPSMFRQTTMRTLDAPVMICETGYGSSDLGRVNFAPNILSEDDRVELVNRYMADAYSWNNLVGIHWYKWEDDPISGRAWDGFNSSQGLVSITDVPYLQLVNALKQWNITFQTRLRTP